jgi:hypothetical protein
MKTSAQALATNVIFVSLQDYSWREWLGFDPLVECSEK